MGMKTMRTLLILAASTIFFSCSDDVEPSNSNNSTSTVTPISSMPATSDVVMYEVNLRAFSLNGDIGGVEARLNNIEDMGANVIWLMPIYTAGELNSVGSPYCIKDYESIDEEYGTLSDLKQFINKAHQKDIAVMMDWVANHTAWDHPWLNKPGWYTTDGNGNVVHPPGTNWTDVADLNYDNADMREAMIGSMEFWVNEVGVDGFRCDYADGVPFDFWYDAIDSLRSSTERDLLFFAEGNRGDHFQAGFDLAFGWNFYGALLSVWNGQSATNIHSASNSEYNGTPSGKHWVRFTTNHDESAWDATPMELFDGGNGALAASAITIFTGGVPLIYGSQEVGTEGTVPFFYNTLIDWSARPGMRQFYERMLTYYASEPAARVGTNTVYTTTDVVCFTKSLNGVEVMVIANTRSESETFDLPTELTGTWLDVLRDANLTLGSQVTLEGYKYWILER